jgi:tetratricopeptide (TPR) repeat protein
LEATGAATTGRVGPSLGSRAEEALDVATADPVRGQRLAADLVVEARRAGDAEVLSTAQQALGLAARERNDVRSALRHQRAAVASARRAGLRPREARARASLCATYLYAGRTAEALREADRAAAISRGLDLARAEMQRAGILARLGRYDESLAAMRPALAALREEGDDLWEARLLNNRGLLHVLTGSTVQARRDLEAAEQLFDRLGDRVAVAHIKCNYGWLAGRRGDIPTALARFDEADEALRRLALPLAINLSTRCEVLLSARLLHEARATALSAVEELDANHMAADAAEARLRLAQAALADGDLPACLEAATAALRALRSQRRPGWVPVARWLIVRARFEDGQGSAALERQAVEVAGRLAASGWAAMASDARILAGRMALRRGQVDRAKEQLRLAGQRIGAAPVDVRIRTWHARALLRVAGGDRGGAERALAAGLRLLDGHRATLGSTDLRTSASEHGTELARLGVDLALADGRPRRVLDWVERARAASLMLRPVRPPQDDELTDALARLRQAVDAVSTAAAAGHAVDRLLRQEAALEEEVRRRSRHARGDGDVGPGPVTVERILGSLGDHALVELIEHEGVFHAVVAAGRRVSLHALGPVDEVRRDVGGLSFAMRRRAVAPDRSVGALRRDADDAAGRLDEVLLTPLRTAVGDRPLVISPSGRLHLVPWSLLPSCRGRPVTVAPSAALWVTASGRPPHHRPGQERSVLVAGPGLAHAAQEVADLARFHRRPLTLVGADATTERVLRAMDGASVAHVAAHSSFRADNPLFSFLDMADGRLTAYDLESLERAPEVLILSACETALLAVGPGDELMGMASATLSLGTRTLVGTLWPVPDDAMHAVMLRLHRTLSTGRPIAEAIAEVQSETSVPDRESVAAAALCCLGAG